MVRHELLSFMDAYLGYNQIPMFMANEEDALFTTNRGFILLQGDTF